MSRLGTLIDNILADPWAEARAHVAGGGSVVGYVGADVPVELILAAQALPLRLYGRAELPTPLADRYLESSFTADLRWIAEQWLSGALDFLQAAILPRSNDSAQRLYYYICELQRQGRCGGPRPLIYDLARIDRTTSRMYSRAATTTLATRLGVTEQNLAAAVETVSRRLALLSQLTSQCPLGSNLQRIVRAANQTWTPAFDSALNGGMNEVPREQHARRILFAGSIPPDDRLHRAVESANGNVICDLTNSPGRHASSIEPTLDAIADCYYDCAREAQAALSSPATLVEHARANRAAAVILWLIEEDEGIVWELPGQVQALRDAGIAVLALTRQRWSADAETLAHIAHFVHSLGASQ